MATPPQGGTILLPVPGQPKAMDPAEFSGSALPNRTTFAFDSIAPPSALYLQRDDVISVHGISGIANETVNFVARFLRVPEPQGGQPSDFQPGKAVGKVITQGIIVPETKAVILPTQGAGLFQLLSQAEGYLLSLCAFSSVAATRGRTFARAIVSRQSVSGIFAQTLFADYCTQLLPCGWPSGARVLSSVEGPGFRHSIQVTNPAAGADWTFTAQGWQRLGVVSFRATYTASAAAANRQVMLIVDDGVNVVWQHDISANIQAGNVKQISAAQSNAPAGITTIVLTLVLPPGLILAPGWRMRTSTINIDVGDQWSNIWLNVDESLDAG